MLKVFVIDIVWVILMNILMYLDKDYVIAHKLHFFDGSNGIQSGISAAFKTIFVVYGVPIIFTIICFFIWMKNKHPKALIYVLGGILLAVIAGILIFRVGNYRKKKLFTPEYLAAASKHYNEYCDGQNDYEKSHYTEKDTSREYVYWTNYHVLSQIKKWNYEPDKIKEYVDAVMAARCEEIPHLTRWEYIHDIETILPGAIKDHWSSNEVSDQVQKWADAKWSQDQMDKSSIRPYVPKVDLKRPIMILYYDDRTIDMLNIVAGL